MIAPGIDDAGVKYATKVEVIAMINPAAVMLKSKPLLYSVADKLMTKNNITVLFPILVNIVVAIAITIKMKIGPFPENIGIKILDKATLIPVCSDVNAPEITKATPIRSSISH